MMTSWAVLSAPPVPEPPFPILLTRNKSKYQSMVLGKKKKLTETPITFRCEDTIILHPEQTELFGVLLDNKLKFNDHIKKICRKVSQQIAVLQRMKKMLPFRTKKDIYFSFILPHFNYCSEIWNTCSARNIAKLEKVNERALRKVYIICMKYSCNV